MRSGLYVGYREAIEMVVTDAMVATFGDRVLHPVLSTASLVFYMEWAGRKVIEPYLEEHEEGIGAAIEVRHLAPAPVGKNVLFTAEVVELSERKVVCATAASHDKAIVGQGRFVQVIIEKERLQKRIGEME